MGIGAIIADFLKEELKLILHPKKLFVKTLSSGVDFLGWVNFSNHRVVRTSTKKRAIEALNESKNVNKLISYCGLLKHGNQYILKKNLLRKSAFLKAKTQKIYDKIVL